MGIGFAFVFGVLVLGVIAVPLSIVCRAIASSITKSAPPETRKQFMSLGTFLPFAGAVYICFCVIAMAALGLVTGRDEGFGDSFELTLNNGYRYTAVDIPDVSALYTDRRDGGYSAEVVTDVLQLQQADDWLAGAYKPGLDRMDSDSSHWKPNHWFLINTRTRERAEASSEAQLGALTSQKGFALHLQSSSEFYTRNRYRWYDAVALVALSIPLMWAAVWLFVRARRIARESRAASR